MNIIIALLIFYAFLFFVVLFLGIALIYVKYHIELGMPFKDAVELFINKFKFWQSINIFIYKNIQV